LALLWQVMAGLLPAQIDQRADLMAHDVAHWQEASHHHHADMALHVDEDADAQSPHQHGHDGVQPPAILTASSALLADVGVAVLGESVAEPPPAVFLEGPLRPPRQHA
jgi:hypothetical protein